LTKIGWDKFWAIFSKIRQVTLPQGPSEVAKVERLEAPIFIASDSFPSAVVASFFAVVHDSAEFGAAATEVAKSLFSPASHGDLVSNCFPNHSCPL
jgi:hypothetical protein